ncbi:MAG: extracellular solute-binding protein [Clostridia bacterium]|nr:extracellular solute-binding protein [Clostridia bacterium]
MKRLASLILAIFLLMPTLLSVGCALSPQGQVSSVLRVCNCEDYIDEDLLAEFTEETGIEVIYSTYGTNENLYNELVINPNSYDLVVPSEYMIEKLAEEGRIQKLDFTQRTELKDYDQNVSPYIKSRLKELEIKKGEHKGENLYDFMVGYMWGTMGWVYDTEAVDVDLVKSWAGVFSEPSLNKRITIKDAVRDSYIVGLAMVYQDELKGVSDNATITEILNRVDQNSIDKVNAKLEEFKPMLYGFEVDSGKNDIINDRIDAYVAWSGDAAYAIDVAAGEVEDEDGNIISNTSSLSYYIPDEGSNIWFDGFVMPSGSNNYDAVYKFLEFISRPETVYRNMDYTGYTGMVASGTFTMEDEETHEEYETDIFSEIVLGWFDESEDLEDGEGIEVDLSYFFGSDGDYTVVVSEEGYGRLIAQYPTAEIVQRCAIMSNFSSDTLLAINGMWESVKGETFPVWLILLVTALVVLLAVVILLYRNKDKIKWLRLPERKTTYAQRKGYTLIKKENIE